MQQKTRYHSLDLLKGLCILFVVITHYAWTAEERLTFLFPLYIDMAVPLFMVISGFVSAKSLYKRGAVHLEDGYEAGALAGKLVRFIL